MNYTSGNITFMFHHESDPAETVSVSRFLSAVLFFFLASIPDLRPPLRSACRCIFFSFFFLTERYKLLIVCELAASWSVLSSRWPQIVFRIVDFTYSVLMSDSKVHRLVVLSRSYFSIFFFSLNNYTYFLPPRRLISYLFVSQTLQCVSPQYCFFKPTGVQNLARDSKCH